MIDSSATTKSTRSFCQLKALQKVLFVKLDKTIVGSTNFVFRFGNTSFISIVKLNTPLEIIVFYNVQLNTPFLLFVANIDKLETFFNNLTNLIIQSNCFYLIIRQYSHIFLLWCTFTYFFITESFMQNLCYFTNIKLCCLYPHFRHLSV